MKKRILPLLLVVLLLCSIACSKSVDPSGVRALSFQDATSVTALKTMNGKTVTIVGYMATLSPVSGTFIYLMNLPYQSCPFCVPNTTQLSNTMAVYAPDGDTFPFTDQPIRVYGLLEMGDFTDEYGYTYNYRITDATYTIVKAEDLQIDLDLWQRVSADGLVSDLYRTFDYLHYICQWTEYQGHNSDGAAWYMYPADVKNYLADTSAYGYGDRADPNWMPSLQARIEAIDGDALSPLTDLLIRMEALEDKAMTELNNGNYLYDESADKYILTNNDALYNEYYSVLRDFTSWLSSFEL